MESEKAGLPVKLPDTKVRDYYALGRSKLLAVPIMRMLGSLPVSPILRTILLFDSTTLTSAQDPRDHARRRPPGRVSSPPGAKQYSNKGKSI